MKKFLLSAVLLAVASPAFADGCGNGVWSFGIGGQFGLNWGCNGINGCGAVGPYCAHYNNGPLYDYSSYFAGQCGGYGDGFGGGYPGAYGGAGEFAGGMPHGGYGAPAYGQGGVPAYAQGAPAGPATAPAQAPMAAPRMAPGQTTGFIRSPGGW